LSDEQKEPGKKEDDRKTMTRKQNGQEVWAVWTIPCPGKGGTGRTTAALAISD
jgi:hypothetical protein